MTPSNSTAAGALDPVPDDVRQLVEAFTRDRIADPALRPVFADVAADAIMADRLACAARLADARRAALPATEEKGKSRE